MNSPVNTIARHLLPSHWLWPLSTIGLLVGCSGAGPEDTPTPGPEATSPPIQTDTPAGEPTATLTPTPAPTGTPTPTLTPTPAPEPTPTQTPEPPGVFSLSSPAFEAGGTLPDLYICMEKTGLPDDTNPPLAWADVPDGTVEFVMLMSTVVSNSSGTSTKYNWVLYDIPLSAAAIPEDNTVITSGHTGTTQVGTPGLTSDGPDYDYSPPCSQGPGLKHYTFTLYALSQSPVFTPNPTPGAGGDGANLEASLVNITLDTAVLTASYTFP